MTSQWSSTSGATGDDWIAAERAHERKMKELELAEKKRRDDRDRWEREERRVRMALVVGFIVVASLIGYGLYLWAQHSGETARQDSEARIACLEQGGTPTHLDSARTGTDWMCLYLERGEQDAPIG